MERIPVVYLSECNECESCLEVCPEVFKRNLETGQIEVVDLTEYPEEAIQEAIAMCPTDCIKWEEAPEPKKPSETCKT